MQDERLGWSALLLLTGAAIPGLRSLYELTVDEPRPDNLDFEADWIVAAVQDVMAHVEAAYSRGERFYLTLDPISELFVRSSGKYGLEATSIAEWLSDAVYAIHRSQSRAIETLRSEARSQHIASRRGTVSGHEIPDEAIDALVAAFDNLGSQLVLVSDTADLTESFIESLVGLGLFEESVHQLDRLNPWTIGGDIDDLRQAVQIEVLRCIQAHTIQRWIRHIVEVMSKDELAIGFRALFSIEEADEVVRYISEYRAAS
ncbi:MAG: hypothetical protein IPM16_04775 [Chloroflexi bacterium]|nr:hypothetical protein [Chloroflexota bacterium]